jgi:hypothetical protein
MTLTIPDEIRGFLFSPCETFWQIQDDDLKDTTFYCIVISVIYTLLSTLITGIAVSKHPALVPVTEHGHLGSSRNTNLFCDRVTFSGHQESDRRKPGIL